MIKEDAQFQNSKNQRIAARIYRSENTSKKGVIFSHGLFSSKDSFKVLNLANEIVDAGFTFLTFDFTFAGESEGNFENLSIIQEVADLKKAAQFFEFYGMESIHIIGSSMGGLVALLFGNETDILISSMSIIAAPFNLKDLMKRIANITDVNSLPDNGMTDISGIFVTNAFFKELDKINLKDIIQKIKSPILVLHGTKDELIDTKSANELFEGLKTEKKLVFIEGGDHTLIREEDINCIRANVIQWIQDH